MLVSVTVSELMNSSANTNDPKFRKPVLLAKITSEKVEKDSFSKFRRCQIICCQKFSSAESKISMKTQLLAIAKSQLPKSVLPNSCYPFKLHITLNIVQHHTHLWSNKSRGLSFCITKFGFSSKWLRSIDVAL